MFTWIILAPLFPDITCPTLHEIDEHTLRPRNPELLFSKMQFVFCMHATELELIQKNTNILTVVTDQKFLLKKGLAFNMATFQTF